MSEKIVTSPDALGAGDDTVSTFQLQGRPVRGRIVRLGTAAQLMLSAHL